MALDNPSNVETDSLGNANSRRKASYSIIENDVTGKAVKSVAGLLKGIFVSAAASSPTIKVWDNTVASGTVLVNTFTPVAAKMYDFGADIVFGTGLFVSVGGSVDCTVFYQ